MKIITLTLNPAFDVHLELEDFVPYKENYAKTAVKNAGGKGINISRALLSYGIKSKAMCILGEGKEEFLSLLNKEGMEIFPFFTHGKIRENITIHAKGKETRISTEGFFVKKEMLDMLFLEIEKEADSRTIVTFTGRIPKGIENKDAVCFLKKIKQTGAKVIVDSNSFTLDELIDIKPFLIKPNEEEIAHLLGECVKDKNVLEETAVKLYKSGIENVLISLGADGFIYAGKSGSYNVKAPRISPVSTIGAGDSTIAGFIAGIVQKKEFCEVLKLSSAFGSAACLTQGTNPPTMSDILRLKKDVIIEKINEKEFVS